MTKKVETTKNVAITKKPRAAPVIEFILGAEYVEVNQLLKLVGACDSGGSGKLLVAQGGVAVDGKAEHRKTAKIRAGQVVTFGELRIAVRAAPG